MDEEREMNYSRVNTDCEWMNEAERLRFTLNRDSHSMKRKADGMCSLQSDSEREMKVYISRWKPIEKRRVSDKMKQRLEKNLICSTRELFCVNTPLKSETACAWGKLKKRRRDGSNKWMVRGADGKSKWERSTSFPASHSLHSP